VTKAASGVGLARLRSDFQGSDANPGRILKGLNGDLILASWQLKLTTAPAGISIGNSGGFGGGQALIEFGMARLPNGMSVRGDFAAVTSAVQVSHLDDGLVLNIDEEAGLGCTKLIVLENRPFRLVQRQGDQLGKRGQNSTASNGYNKRGKNNGRLHIAYKIQRVHVCRLSIAYSQETCANIFKFDCLFTNGQV